LKKFSFTLLCLLIFSVTGLIGSVKKTLVPVKIEGQLTIDGKLQESEWETTSSATDFIQFEPKKGEPANFKTKIKVLYNDTFIYFGVVCYDPNPKKITARLTKRDSDLEEDDSIGIGLDTFKDGRTAYYFFTNPLSTQSDGRLSDNGRTADSTWDAEWKSKAEINPEGWTAEFAIPFSILKFNPGENKNWGLGLVRTIPRKLEQDTWTGPVEAITRVSQFGILKGLNLVKAKKKIKVIPHMISRFEEDKKAKVTGGVDTRYAISQNISSDLTVNPDFATVEADQEQINLTRFELQLPEKRNFFLEGSEIYEQRIRLFYSRRIADIYGGLKLYGKKSGYEFAAMSVQRKPDDELGTDSANYSVLRLRKDIFKSSTIGFLGANKLINGRNYGNVGIDLVHFFSEKVNLTGQLALSYGDYSKENIAFFIRPSYDSSTFHIHLRYTQLGKNFAKNANSVGFVRDDDRHEFDSAVRKTWWIKKHGFDRVAYDSNYNIYWSTKGKLRSYEIEQEFEVDFTSKFSFEVEYTNEYKLYEKEFYNYQWGLKLGYNTREWQSARINYTFGKNFDLKFKLIGGGVNYKLLKSLSFEYELDRLIFEPDPEDESTWIHVVRLTNYFTKNLYFKLFYQTNTSISKYNYQALFVYRYKPPFGTIQLAYQKGSRQFGEVGDQKQIIFLKLTYVFNL